MPYTILLVSVTFIYFNLFLSLSLNELPKVELASLFVFKYLFFKKQKIDFILMPYTILLVSVTFIYFNLFLSLSLNELPKVELASLFVFKYLFFKKQKIDFILMPYTILLVSVTFIYFNLFLSLSLNELPKVELASLFVFKYLFFKKQKIDFILMPYTILLVSVTFIYFNLFLSLFLIKLPKVELASLFVLMYLFFRNRKIGFILMPYTILLVSVTFIYFNLFLSLSLNELPKVELASLFVFKYLFFKNRKIGFILMPYTILLVSVTFIYFNLFLSLSLNELPKVELASLFVLIYLFSLSFVIHL
ncbi:hypothetical protein IGK51_003469 [Enterococcus sp. DIV0098]